MKSWMWLLLTVPFAFSTIVAAGSYHVIIAIVLFYCGVVCGIEAEKEWQREDKARRQRSVYDAL